MQPKYFSMAFAKRSSHPLQQTGCHWQVKQTLIIKQQRVCCVAIVSVMAAGRSECMFGPVRSVGAHPADRGGP
ncbi:hypothetical protein F2P81_004964 [Scophthalmus maximus]|uniref:Uncharacterized protein n=1 Tax=Scophthalmus maximus TaxID=52904 RepID=A0A6A4TAX9_SCOMX|nr:hypothetical protein F2P81_004964 [Scophthalmus maximus]